MDRRRFLLTIGAPAALAACGQKVWAPDEMVTRMAYRDPGPAYLELVTMINNRTNQGAHSGLVINASQRVIWDPAGTFAHKRIPERNDVLFGVNPEVYAVYRSSHARETHHVVFQRKIVAPEVAEKAFELAKSHGPAANATCSMTTSGILMQLPGFESIKSEWFPHKLMAQFAQLPGVETKKHFENDAGDKSEAFKKAAEYVPQTF